MRKSKSESKVLKRKFYHIEIIDQLYQRREVASAAAVATKKQSVAIDFFCEKKKLQKVLS